MEISGIYTNRKYQKWPHWHIVHEWEDIVSKEFKIPKINSYFKDQIIRRVFFRSIHFLKLENLLLKIDSLLRTNKKYFVFEMYPRSYFSFQSSKKAIPIIIDFDYNIELSIFYKVYKNCSVLFITNLEAYNYLQKNNCPLNIYHWPLSFPDKYIKSIKTTEPKTYDIILAGRKNEVLWKYLLHFEENYPSIEYIYLDIINENLLYVSNKKGIIGEFHDRHSFLTLLKKCRVAFYSTVGIDDEKRLKCMNHVTPRLFELMSAGCLLMGRYPENSETRFFGLNNICPHINDYNEFETILLKYLKNESFDFLNDYYAYLSNQSTSKRVKELIKTIEKF